VTGSVLEVLLGGALAFAEAMLGVGVVLPGEVMITGIAASIDDAWHAPLFLAVTVGATVGDHVNYWLGRLLGPRLRGSRLVARLGLQYWDRAVTMIQRHGARAVVVSRLLPVVRTLMAAVAGVSHLRYRSFAAASLVGSALWAALWVSAGGALGGLLENNALLVPALLVVGLLSLVVVLARRRAARRRDTTSTAATYVVPSATRV